MNLNIAYGKAPPYQKDEAPTLAWGAACANVVMIAHMCAKTFPWIRGIPLREIDAVQKAIEASASVQIEVSHKTSSWEVLVAVKFIGGSGEVIALTITYATIRWARSRGPSYRWTRGE